MKERFNPETEEGRRNKEKRSQLSKAQFDPETERGRKQRENRSNKRKEYFNPNTEEGRKNKEKRSQSTKAQFDINTESGRQNREDMSEIKIEFYKTERGRRRRENHSEFMKEFYNPETELGRRNIENRKIITQKRVETNLQNRQNASILGELMFDEEFIKENFLILDDKNNLRFLWSVYSKLSGFSKSFIYKEKRIGKLSFLHGITSIKLSEELELAKIEEIKAIIKNRNNKKNKQIP